MGDMREVSNMKPFNSLSLGTRFVFPDSNEVYIVLETHGRGLICRATNKSRSEGQSMCCFTDENHELTTPVNVPPELNICEVNSCN